MMLLSLIVFAVMVGSKNFISILHFILPITVSVGLPLYNYTYILLIAAAFMVAIDKYRWAILTFLSFTYIELMDKTTYLNHYYFITVISYPYFYPIVIFSVDL
jgi:hypothetical protein